MRPMDFFDNTNRFLKNGWTDSARPWLNPEMGRMNKLIEAYFFDKNRSLLSENSSVR